MASCGCDSGVRFSLFFFFGLQKIDYRMRQNWRFYHLWMILRFLMIIFCCRFPWHPSLRCPYRFSDLSHCPIFRLLYLMPMPTTYCRWKCKHWYSNFLTLLVINRQNRHSCSVREMMKKWMRVCTKTIADKHKLMISRAREINWFCSDKLCQAEEDRRPI